MKFNPFYSKEIKQPAVFSLVTETSVENGLEVLLPFDRYDDVFLGPGRLVNKGKTPRWLHKSYWDVDANLGEQGYFFMKPHKKNHEKCDVPETHSYHCLLGAVSHYESPFSSDIIARISEKEFASAIMIAKMQNSSPSHAEKQWEAYQKFVKYLDRTLKPRTLPQGTLHRHNYPHEYQETSI